MGRIALEIHRFFKEYHRRDLYIRESDRPLRERRRTGNDIEQRMREWATIMNSCILAEQPLDFIP
ncbi:MAG: hypothetical protein KF722_09990 [Nitrospira sp.]|nr:hypothetical protein [Nitrospira sp.]